MLMPIEAPRPAIAAPRHAMYGRMHCMHAHQKLVGMRLPLPQLGYEHVTLSSSVFCRHLQRQRQRKPGCLHACVPGSLLPRT